MKSTIEVGMNRTGIATSPVDAKELAEAAEATTPSAPGNELAIDEVRKVYEEESGNVGSVPPPLSLKGIAGTFAKAIKGEHIAVLVDKLGERLAFERTGVRLYDALIQKRRASMNGDATAPLDQLELFRDEEAAHFAMLKEAMESLGGDPTAETPCADVSAVMSSGIPKVLTDPRTTFTQCLEAILVAELADNDGWKVLIELAEGMGNTALAERFRAALQEEDRHLEHVRRWLSSRVLGEAGVSAAP